MVFSQTVVPDPFIPCKPGWCLMYVRQAFGASAVEPTATAGWVNAKRRHEDMNFPEGCWVPVWFSLKFEPAGHVALLAPDGSVYSTTHPTNLTATHHPSMAHLMAAYERYNPLTFLGWSEDISGVTVVEPATISLQSTIIEEVDIMAALSDEEQRELLGNTRMLKDMVTNVSTTVLAVAESVNAGKPVDEETMKNVRKLTNELVYGVPAE